MINRRLKIFGSKKCGSTKRSYVQVNNVIRINGTNKLSLASCKQPKKAYKDGK